MNDQQQDASTHEQNPNAVFQGLGFLDWLKVMFRTRAGLIKQNEKVIDMLFSKLNDACADAALARKTGQKFATVMIRQHNALVQAETQLRDDDSYGEARELAHKAVVEAIEAAKAYI